MFLLFMSTIFLDFAITTLHWTGGLMAISLGNQENK